MKRLLPMYVDSVLDGEISDDVIGEVSTVVRALRSALDKLANSLHMYLEGAESRGYFPLADDPKDFEDALIKGVGDALALDPKLAEAIRTCQPFNPKYNVLRKLRVLYRVNAHRGYELHEVHSEVTLTEVDVRTRPVEEWPGVPTERKTYDVLGAATGRLYADGSQDWFFANSDDSVFGLLFELHNTVVRAIEVVLAEQTTGDEIDRIRSAYLHLSWVPTRPRTETITP